MLEEQGSRALCQQVLRHCGQEAAEALLTANESALTRFANNAIHQNVAERDRNLTVRVILEQRSGIASTNRTDPASLEEVVARARASAQASPEDPGHPGLAEPAAYTPVDSFDPLTAGYSPEQRAQAVGVVCRLANEKGLNASGALSSGFTEIAVANSQGLFAYHAATEAAFQTVVMAPDASGRAQASAWRVDQLPVEDLGQEAIDKAERGQKPRAVEPGEYAVVFDPYVTGDLLNILDMSGMGGQAVLDGRSWMNGRMGEKAMSPSVSIWDDGLDPRGLPMPFDFEGVPRQRVEIVSQGTVRGPVYDRYTARKAGTESTGHALPPGMRTLGPIALNLFMAPGEDSLEAMIAATDRGLYITRFWYTRLAHPRDCVVTGMTRDGVFMIEGGELAYPVKNLRFTQSYVQALAGVRAIGRQTRLLTSDYIHVALHVPPLALEAFNFTGVTV